MAQFGLSENTLKQIREVLSQYPSIQKVLLYGSRAKGNYKNGSDIDITLIGQDLPITLPADIDDTLDDLYLPYTFDISVYDHITNTELKNHIDRVAKVFYENVGVVDSE